MNQEELKACVFAVKFLYGAKRDAPAAVEWHESGWNGLHEYKIRDVRHFVKRTADKLEQHCTLHNLPGAGRPRKLPDAVVKEAAGNVSQWYMQQHDTIINGVAYAYDEHTMYTSMSYAIMRSPRLAAIVFGWLGMCCGRPCGVWECHSLWLLHMWCVLWHTCPAVAAQAAATV